MRARDAYLCDAVRTPIGRFAGELGSIRADDLAAIPIAALLARNPDLPGNVIDEVILGCANQAGEDNRNVARMALLLAGVPESVPGVTVNRLCASGAEAVGQAARGIISGELELVIAGGVESMTRAPFVMGKPDRPFVRSAELQDTTIGWRFVNPKMNAAFGTDSMPETAENVARDYSVSREDQDRLAFSSQERTAAAQARGYFAREIVPVEVPQKGGVRHTTADEHPRPQTTMEQLAALKPIVCPGGSVTAGNSSGINDGASAMIIASENAVARYGLTPRCRITGMATAGVAPRVMGIGPVFAVEKLCQIQNQKVTDFDLIEINEAFAAQVIASMRGLGVNPFDPAVNSNGGAIALGHPLGASGARLVMTAAHALEENDLKRALVTMCVGVGQGLALSLERLR